MSKLQKKAVSLCHGGGAWGRILAGGLVSFRVSTAMRRRTTQTVDKTLRSPWEDIYHKNIDRPTEILANAGLLGGQGLCEKHLLGPLWQ